MFFNRFRVFALTLVCAMTCLLVTQSAWANELLEEGPNYFVVQHDAGGTTGSVTMRMDISIDALGTMHVTSRIISISAQPGWTWIVRKSGGVDKAVEVQFEQGKKRLVFKALYVPGKTVIDGGVIK